MAVLLDTIPQTGAVAWIGVRAERRGQVRSVEAAELLPGLGVAGDHRTIGREPNPSSSRQLTLLQAEHLAVIASLAGAPEVRPEWTRRNVLVRGINLLALKDRRFRLGGVLIEGTGICHPCSRMEENLGPGAYNAMRGHGGITARILERGTVRVGDPVVVADAAADPASSG
jgi:MOSC domain-containing protein YiiM